VEKKNARETFEASWPTTHVTRRSIDAILRAKEAVERLMESGKRHVKDAGVEISKRC
jgi:hypothetical protein